MPNTNNGFSGMNTNMGLMRRIRKGTGKLFNLHVDRWLDYSSLKGNAIFFYQQFKTLYHVDQPTHTETFETAVSRLALTSDQLQLQLKHFRFLTRFFLCVSFLILSYGLWIGLHGNWMGGFMSFALVLYSLSFAFRYDFWRYQIQHQTLGCSVKEWIQSLFSKAFNKGKIL